MTILHVEELVTRRVVPVTVIRSVLEVEYVPHHIATRHGAAVVKHRLGPTQPATSVVDVLNLLMPFCYVLTKMNILLPKSHLLTITLTSVLPWTYDTEVAPIIPELTAWSRSSSAITCHSGSSWLEALPAVFLDIRSVSPWESSSFSSLTSIVTDTPVDGEFFLPPKGHKDPSSYVVRL